MDADLERHRDRSVSPSIAVMVILLVGILPLGLWALLKYDGGTSIPAHTASKVTASHQPQMAHPAAAHDPQSPTVGPVPPSAWKSGGGIDLSQVPDFIPALSNGKVVGYISKSEMFPTQPSPQPSGTNSQAPYVAPTAADMAAQNAKLVYTVYGPDLVTVVGHDYPGAGFVPLGGTPQPSSTVTTVTGYGFPPTGS
jgi:hypothetical protein